MHSATLRSGSQTSPSSRCFLFPSWNNSRRSDKSNAETPAIDCYPQFATVRKVRLAQLARPMLLGKEHLPRRPFRRPPVTDPAPQCPYLPVTESAWMRLLKMLKQRLRL